MDNNSQVEQKWTSSTTQFSERKRTRLQRQRCDSWQQQHCRHVDHNIDAIGASFFGASQSPIEEAGLEGDICTADVQNCTSQQHVPCTHTHEHRYNKRCYIRHQAMFSLAAAALLLCYPAIVTYVDAASQLYSRSTSALFVSTPINTSRQPHPLMSIQRKTPQTQQKRKIVRNDLDTTWSKAVRQTSELNESKFGVRKRVKSVLKKAKKRTGVENSSDNARRTTLSKTDRVLVNGEASLFVQSGLNIVAETASIGGLGESEDVALDYVSKKGSSSSYNDTASRTIISGIQSSTSGGSYEDPAILNKLMGDRKNGVQVTSAQMQFYGTQSVASITSTTSIVTQSSKSTTTTTATLSPSSAFQRPEDDFIVREKNRPDSNDTTANKQTYIEKDAFTGDVSAAFSLPREPLPFKLPELDPEQSRRVVNGERVQYQDDMGRAGSGFVVVDVKAPASVVWDCLLDFQAYPQTIPTCREVVMYTNTHLKEDYRAEKPIDYEDGTVAICKHGVPSVTRAQFSLSKFRLKIAAVHKYRPHPKGDYMIFTLDPASTNMVLKYAKGIWYTQSNPDGKEGYTRVWLLCELRVSRLLPQWIVDYAAARAMPRATTWLKPQTETAAELWLKDTPPGRR